MGKYTDIDSLVERYWKIIKVPHDQAAKDFLGQSQSHTVKANGTSYKYYQRGSGPIVLLVHGVHSNLGCMVPIAEDLLEHGFQVVLFDAPAHGEALGTSTNPLEVREVIRALIARLGEVHAVVGHSLGALWTFGAWNEESKATAIVSIASPCDHRFLVDKFAEMHTVDPELVHQLIESIEGLLGERAWVEFSPKEVAKTVGVPGLIVHGANDDFVPPEHAGDLHAAWSGSTVELVDGVGHFDLLASPRVRAAVSAYLLDVK